LSLYALEKGLEVLCCLLFALPVAAMAIGWPVWTGLLLTAGLLVALFFGHRMIVEKIHRSELDLEARGVSPSKLNRAIVKFSRLRLSACMLLTGCCFFFFWVQIYCCLRGFGGMPGWYVCLLFPVINMAQWIPVSVGGFGLRESAAFYLLPRYGIDPEIAVLAFLCVSVANIFIVLVLWLLSCCSAHTSKHRN
jgi:uncharacterized membrane protein YbhN (UPF0104 family)